MSFVELRGINVCYDKQKETILKELNLSIKKGELISLLGPSGCGKTTTLRVIAGLIETQSGTFKVDGEELTKVPVHQRNFGMVFQSYALFPHLTVLENIKYGLKLRKEKKKIIDEKVTSILSICGLEELAMRYPKQLSGGQRQRVALARALVIEPKLLLLDEPLSNLDAKLRIAMRIEIRRIQQKLGMTTVFVTHDQEECFAISDRVAILNNGVIEQFAAPEQIYQYPASKFVAEFIGFENFILVKKIDEGYYQADNDEIIFKSAHIMSHSDEVVLTIRPDDIAINEAPHENSLQAKVLVRTFLGKSFQYEVVTNVGKLLVTDYQSRNFDIGSIVYLSFNEEKTIILENKS